MSAPHIVSNGLPLVIDGESVTVYQVRDAVSLTVHQLLSEKDEATRRDVEFESAEGEPHTVSVADPYTWNLATFALVANRQKDAIVITATCEVAQ